jgi:hypothetical protein
MILIRPAEQTDTAEICAFLQRHMKPAFEAERWQRLLHYPWREDESNAGCVVTDAGRMVGFLGAVQVTRQIADARHRTANLTSWYLEKPYRGGSLGLEMLLAAMPEPGTTYTVFSSRPRVLRFMRRAGLQELDRDRLTWRRRNEASEAIEVLRNAAPIADLIGASQRQLLADHIPFGIQPVLLRTAAGDCLILLSIKTKGAGILYHEVLHMSDAGIFAAHAQTLADALLPESTAAVLAADRRFLTNQVADASVETIPSPRYYRPGSLPPRHIDFLYSELVLLDLKLF